jgi:hypothetical protein
MKFSVPEFLLSKESLAEKRKKEAIAELESQKNGLLRQEKVFMENKMQIEAWPGDKAGGGSRNELKDDTVLIAELKQKIGAIDEQVAEIDRKIAALEAGNEDSLSEKEDVTSGN